MKEIRLSAVLAVFNEEPNLSNCLASVKDLVNEIVVVDGGSTDRTVEIAQSFGAKIIRTNNPPMFHINKQKALDAASGDWVLQLDADEIVTVELSKEIISKTQNATSDIQGYYIPRKNFFMGHWMRKGGQYPDYVIRLFRRGKGTFPSKSVHEQITIDGKTAYLRNPLLHDTYKSIDEYWLKANRYIGLSAKDLAIKNTPKNFGTYLTFMVFKPTATFLNVYIRHLGVVDGIPGFLFALFSSLHLPLSYIRYIRTKE